MRLILPEAP